MRSKGRFIFISALNALLLIASIAAMLTYAQLSGLLLSQSTAQRWRGQGETRFAQVSAFLPVGGELDVSAIYSFRNTVEQALISASMESTEEVNLWIDAYSAKTTASAKGNKGSQSVATYGVGGEFFYFHPLTLVFGNYIHEDDFARDCVVISRELAWGLFGAVDVVGMTVEINAEPYIVVGVVDMEDDFASKAAMGENRQFLFMHYDRLFDYGESAVNSYEIVITDPISRFGYNLVRDNFPGNGDLVENSARYTLGTTASMIANFGKRSINTVGVIYPYWENAARFLEDWCILLAVLSGVFILTPVVFAVLLIVKAVRRLKQEGKRVAHRIREKY